MNVKKSQNSSSKFDVIVIGSGISGGWAAKQGSTLKSGYTSFQSESHPIEFKNIELLKLK